MENTKRLFLIFHGRYPSEKAASLFAAKSAEAFAAHGIAVTLLVPRRFKTLDVDDRAYYELKSPFEVVYLPTIDFFPFRIFERIAFRISLLFFSYAVWTYLRLNAANGDIVYSNETLPLIAASYVVKNCVYEMHDYPGGLKMYYEFLFDHVRHVVVTNKQKMQRLEKDYPHAVPLAFYEANAVSLDEYASAPTKEEARVRLNLPQDECLVIYTGHLYSWKGVDTLARSFSFLPPNTFIYVVGGTEKDVTRMREKYPHTNNLLLKFEGHRPHEEMVLWQKAADVLVVPNTGKEKISAEDTSPMKLFEYMASGTPVVASDLPSIREIAGDGRAVLVTPDDPKALAQGVRNVLEQGGATHSKRALEWVENHTWEKRAERILQKIA